MVSEIVRNFTTSCPEINGTTIFPFGALIIIGANIASYKVGATIVCDFDKAYHSIHGSCEIVIFPEGLVTSFDLVYFINDLLRPAM